MSAAPIRLCYAQLIAGDQPFIGITESGFDQDSFWRNPRERFGDLPPATGKGSSHRAHTCI